MATPTLTKHTVPGALGEILIDVRAADRTTPAPAVIVLHGFKGFKDWGMFPSVADRLARAGFTAVSPNLSGSGVDDSGEFSRPERFAHNTFSAEQTDLSRVLEALDGGLLGVVRPSSVGILGHSRGGGDAILFAAREPRVEALVTWAAIATVRRWTAEQIAAWRAAGRNDIVNARTGQVLPMLTDVLDDVEAHGSGSLDIEAAAARISVPWLLVHGTADEAVPVAEAERLAARAAANPRFEKLLLPGAGHTLGAVHPYAGPTEHLERAVTTAVRVFGGALR